MSGKLEEADKQAMIRAYADQNDLGWPPELMQQWPSNLHQRRWEVCWLTALRHGMERSTQICEAVRDSDSSISIYIEGFNDGATACIHDITAAMPAKEEE